MARMHITIDDLGDGTVELGLQSDEPIGETGDLTLAQQMAQDIITHISEGTFVAQLPQDKAAAAARVTH